MLIKMSLIGWICFIALKLVFLYNQKGANVIDDSYSFHSLELQNPG